jgi:hypothetical protein
MNNFISEYKNALPSIVCENLIELFEKRTDLHVKGKTTLGVNKDWKDDTEISIDPDFLDEDKHPDFSILIQSLLLCLQEGIEKYKKEYTIIHDDGEASGIDVLREWRTDFEFNIQRYLPGEGYKSRHCEIPTSSVSKRVLVWMFYLNDVEDQGGTEFTFQNYVCKAEKGKLVIWPPYWTHFHRGIISPSEKKYIVTGWCSFYDEE